MSWFLSSKKKVKSRKPQNFRPPRNLRSGTRRGTGKSILRRMLATVLTLRTLKITACVTIVLLLVIGVYFGHNWIVNQVAHSNRSQAIPYIVLVDAPNWRIASFDNDIQRIIVTTVSPNPMDNQSLEAAALHLGKNPWIEKVNRLVRCYDGRIELYATYREPVALVLARDGYHLIDHKCVRLPGVYLFEQLKELSLPVIEGALEAAPPAEGSPWNRDDIRAGLNLAILLSTHDFADQIKAVDVSNFAGRVNPAAPQLVLRTARGIVRWGSPVGFEVFGEPVSSKKLHNLHNISRRYNGPIDADGQIVDINHDIPLIHTHNQIQYTSQ